MKFKLVTITFLYLGISQFSVCQTINRNMEKLDISAIINKIDSYGLGNTIDYQEIKVGDTVFIFSKSSNVSSAFSFYEEDILKGEISYVHGDEVHGFTNESYNRTDPKIEFIMYDSLGVIKSIYTMYSEKELKENSREIEFPIGKEYYYDDSGLLIKTIDYSEIFKFSYENVKELLSKKDPEMITKSIIGMDYPNGPAWTINYFSPIFKSCEMMIDASSGEIIYDYHDMQSSGN